MENRILLHDYSEIILPRPESCYDSESKKWVDPNLNASLAKLKGPQLKVKIKATFSGVLTNRRVYPGTRVKKAAKTWVNPYDCPVLPRHPEKGLFSSGDEPEPVGRVAGQKYIRLVQDETWEEDYKKPANFGQLGSGYIHLTTLISGQDNIEKVLDGRWKTTSAGMFPAAMICSVCAKDWMSDMEPCEHKPGQTYEIKKDKRTYKLLAYLIAPPKRYDHIAFVNTPAAGLSGIDEISAIADALGTDEVTKLPANSIDEFSLLDSFGKNFIFYEKSKSEKPKAVSFVSLPTHSTEDKMTEDKTLLERIAEKIQDHWALKDLKDEPELSKDVLNFICVDSEDENAFDLEEEFKEMEFTDQDIEDLLDDFTDAYYPDGDAERKRPQDRPGGSNVGKYKKSEGPFCGPSGGAPAGSYPIGTLKRAKAALAYARHAPKPEGIRACVCNKWGSKLPSCQKGKKKDEVQEYAWIEFGIEKDYESRPEPEDGKYIDEFGPSESKDVIELMDLKLELPYPKAVPTPEERRKMEDSDFAGPNRTFVATTSEQIENSYAQLEKNREYNDDVKNHIKSCLDLRASKLLDSSNADSSDEREQPQKSQESGKETVVRVLEDKVESLERKMGNLRAALDEKSEEAERTRKALLAEKKLNRQTLIDRVVDLKLALRKPEVAELKSEEDITAFKEKLAGRSVDSLSDTIADLRLELVASWNTEFEKKIQDKQLENDSPKKGKTKDVEETQEKTTAENKAEKFLRS